MTARLDRTKPPPGYDWHPWRPHIQDNPFAHALVDEGNRTVLETIGAEHEHVAIAAAWAHYQEHHDPPNSMTWSAERRAAAWARYWRGT